MVSKEKMIKVLNVIILVEDVANVYMHIKKVCYHIMQTNIYFQVYMFSQ